MQSAVRIPAFIALSRSFRVVRNVIETPRRHQRSKDLLKLNDHLLKDIGLNRNDILYRLPDSTEYAGVRDNDVNGAAGGIIVSPTLSCFRFPIGSREHDEIPGHRHEDEKVDRG